MKSVNDAYAALLAALFVLFSGGCCCCLPPMGNYNTQTQDVHSDRVLNVTDADFEEMVLNSKKPVLVDFWAPWCGPCRMLNPAINAIADEQHKELTVARLNTDENYETSRRYNVSAIPLLILFDGGQVVDQHVGVPDNGTGDVTLATKEWLAQAMD